MAPTAASPAPTAACPTPTAACPTPTAAPTAAPTAPPNPPSLSHSPSTWKICRTIPGTIVKALQTQVEMRHLAFRQLSIEDGQTMDGMISDTTQFIQPEKSKLRVFTLNVL